MTTDIFEPEIPWHHNPMMVALLAALSIHAVIILVVGFQMITEKFADPAQHLDVVLVNWQSEEKPEEADYLAQADQRGGGTNEENLRPAQKVKPPLPSLETAEAEISAEAGAPAASFTEQDVIVSNTSEQTAEAQVEQVENEALDMPTAEQLMTQIQQMARLLPEQSRNAEWHSKNLRRKFVSANTRKYEYASYMQAWVAKVERVGNLHYPEAVRKLKLRGDLLLIVGIYQDGSVESITLKRSSGMPELDEAAMEIVRIAAPYSPLPANISKDVDVLHITRTWRFSPRS
ncbi:MAG: energy transducer TonB [Xanthomonadales bacterium]|nr:energy transducer TonB [Xanthomonadales bacterium]